MMSRIGRIAIYAGLLAHCDTVAVRVKDALFHYKFERRECVSGYATDGSEGIMVFGNLKIDTSQVDCKGLGVEARSGILRDQRIISTENSSLFNEIVSTSEGWTIEAWATLDDFSDCPSCDYRHIASIGSIDEDGPQENCGRTSNLLLFQSKNESSVGMLLTGGRQCQSTKAHPVIEWGSPVHITFTTELSHVDDTILTRWYINGVPAGDGRLKDTLQHWSGGFYLQLLNDAVSVRNSPWFASPRGSVFLLVMYSRALSGSDVIQNYHAGLENSPPVAENITVTITENGELGDYYDSSKFYQECPTVPMLDLPIIHLEVLDLDEEKGFPVTENYTEALGTVIIESLPAKGKLYDIDGEEITNIPRNITCKCGFMLRYRPVKNDFSGPNDVYASLMYSAVDAITGEVSVVPGFVTIHVLPKNDPPIPTNASERAIVGKSHTILLNGTDVDSIIGDLIDGAMIVKTPEHGLLYQVFENGTRSGVLVRSGDQLWGRVTSYFSLGDKTQVSRTFSTEYMILDEFTFRVFDSSNGSSAVGVLSLVVKSGLQAMTAQSQNDTSWRCIEDEENVINMYVRDSVDNPRHVIIVISAVPEHGTLLVVNTSRALVTGDEVASVCLEGGLCMSSIIYRPEADYYNLPHTRRNALNESSVDCFKFYAIAGEFGEYSEEITQEIQVINKNDPSIIQCPNNAGVVQPAGTALFSSTAEYFHLDRITLSGFTVVDPDLDIDAVKVVVKSDFGLLTLNQSHVNDLDFSSSAYCFEGNTPQCSGSGSTDREAIFVALPSQVIMALDGMVYQSLASSVVDLINITVLDGVDGGCLSQNTFETESLQDGCWVRSCSIHVSVQPRGTYGAQKLSVDDSILLWICLSFGSIMLVFMVLEWCRPSR